jgi:hypothetical protein
MEWSKVEGHNANIECFIHKYKNKLHIQIQKQTTHINTKTNYTYKYKNKLHI